MFQRSYEEYSNGKKLQSVGDSHKKYLRAIADGKVKPSRAERRMAERYKKKKKK